MPKKNLGENSKAVAAKTRKKLSEDVLKNKLKQEEEDALWKNDDDIIKKQQKREQKERKKLEQVSRKSQNRALLEEEVSSICIKSGKVTNDKITRAQINKSKKVETKLTNLTHLEIPMEENVNKMIPIGDEARNVIDAIKILSVVDEIDDRHPEKRIKAAYKIFERKRLEELRIEKPSLKLSQLKQLVFKDWQKSSENPVNLVR